MPTRVRLAEALGSRTTILLALPEGDGHQIILDVPASGTAPSGRLAIAAGGKTVVDITIRPEDLQDCNWLHETSKGKTYILTWEFSKLKTLRSFLEPKQKCYIELALNAPPPEGSSLWLFWVEGVNVFAQSLTPRTQEQMNGSVQPSLQSIGAGIPQAER
jgi:hypothetical protein